MTGIAHTSTDPPQERTPFSEGNEKVALTSGMRRPDVDYSSLIWQQPDDTALVIDSHTPEFKTGPSLISRAKTLPPTVPQKLELLILATVLIIVASMLFVPGTVDLGNWGYPGAFVINALSTATLLLPAPGIALIVSMANELNPIGLGVASGLGGAIGSLTAYWAGAQGQAILWVHAFVHGEVWRRGAVSVLRAGNSTGRYRQRHRGGNEVSTKEVHALRRGRKRGQDGAHPVRHDEVFRLGGRLAWPVYVMRLESR
jgi:hypothetical protein